MWPKFSGWRFLVSKQLLHCSAPRQTGTRLFNLQTECWPSQIWLSSPCNAWGCRPDQLNFPIASKSINTATLLTLMMFDCLTLQPTLSTGDSSLSQFWLNHIVRKPGHNNWHYCRVWREKKIIDFYIIGIFTIQVPIANNRNIYQVWLCFIFY